MKISVKKKGLLLTIATFIVALLCSVLLLTPVKTARAAAITDADNTTFAMMEKAQVRLAENAGMRFRVKLGGATKTAIESADSAGFLIFPKAYLTADVIGAANYIDKKVVAEGVVDDTKTGLYDYVNVAIDTTKIYEDTTESAYMANGVIWGIKENNRDLQFAAIAYYEKDGAYTYASFNSDFSRSISYVLGKCYLNEADKRASVMQYFDWLGSENNAIEISSSEDLEALSAAVAESESFENMNFSLTADVTVDDFTPVSADFAGVVNGNNNTVTMVNAGNKALFENDSNVSNVNVVSDKSYALKSTENVVDRITADKTTAKIAFVEKNELAEGYTVQNGAFSIEVAEEKTKVYAALNYTKAELQAYVDAGTYNTITFSIYFTTTEESAISTGPDSLLSKGLGGTSKSIPTDAWEAYSVDLATLLENTASWNGDNLYVVYSRYVGTLYLGDILLGRDVEKAYLENSLATNVMSANENATYKFVANADLPEAVKKDYTGDVIKFTSNKQNNEYIYMTMKYSRTELEALKETYGSVTFRIYIEAGLKEDGTTQVQVKNNAADDSEYVGLYNKAGYASANVPINEWQEITISIDDLIEIMNPKQSDGTTKRYDGATDYTMLIMRCQLGGSSTEAKNYSANFYFGAVTFVENTPAA